MGLRTFRLLAWSAVLGMAMPALAQEGESDLPDKYSVRTEQKLMLTGKVKNTLPPLAFTMFYSDLGFNRFKVIKQANPNSQDVRDWCNEAVKDTQVRRDDVDGETGDANVTMEAKAARCSEILKHDLVVKHKCAIEDGILPWKKGKKYHSCTVEAYATIYKYKFKPGGPHGFTFVPDKKFGKKGKIREQSMWVFDSEVGGVGAKDRALLGATIGAALWMKRSLRGIKDFQVHSPILSVKDGEAKACLGQDTVEPDMPLLVVFKTSKGEVQKGFAKARDIHDGCTMTPSMVKKQAEDTAKRLKRKKKPRKLFTLKPMASEIILGGSDVKQGMTLWELPSIGLNVGLTGGVSTFSGISASGGDPMPSVGLGLEFNTAPYLYRLLGGYISEFHIFMNGRLTLGASTAVISSEVGLLKRAYLVGPLFAELGVGAAVSRFGDQMKIGGSLQGGLGFQLSPRVLMKFEAGYLTQEGGIKGLVMFLYNI